MAGNPDVLALLEEMLESGRTAEEVCRDCPELLPEVRRRWKAFRLVDGEVAALFPDPETPPGADTTVVVPPPAGLPQVPGYRVEAVLGRGGMGVVYRAWHLRLHRPVALKMLLAGPCARPDELERFQREAQAVAGLHHPNVVQVHDVGEVDGRPYFTMEFVEGGDLAEQTRGAPQPAGQAAALVATLAEAVHAAHQSGIVHRDLKPGNVLLAADGTPKVSDFGVARRLEGDGGLTLSGLPLGTPSYMAPEQARGKREAIGPATDVYALGAILYELLTGRPPFRAESGAATLQQVLADEPVPPARLNPRVPRDLETICLKCLNKEPPRRYASASALADDLRRFERGEPIAARPAGPLERAAKWARRRPAAAVLLAAGLLMVVGVTGAAAWYVNERFELQHRGREVNREANDALDQAERHLEELRVRREDPLRAGELLSDIDRWQSLVDQAQQDLQRARSACVGNEALVADPTRARLRTVEATLSNEETNYRLARELDDIAAAALASEDGSLDGLRKALRTARARYAAFFARLGVDVGRTDTAGAVAAITSSPIRLALLAGLDFWADATARTDPRDPELARLLGLARAADPEPWRNRFRHAAVWRDRAALSRLAGEVDVRRQPPTILASLGWRLAMTGAGPTALYQQALVHHPRDFWLHMKAAFDVPEPAVGTGLYLAALAIRPTSVLAWNNLAITLHKRKDFRAAADAARKAIALNPRYTVAYNTLGSALRELKDLPGAFAALRKALALAPRFAMAHNNLGMALQDSKDLPGAVAAYKKAIELDADFVQAHNNLGVALLHQGELAAATAALKKAIELDPKAAAAYGNLGLVLRDQGDVRGAIALFQKAIELDPTRARTHVSLGWTLRQNKDLAGAVAALKKATELDPSSANVHTLLGDALRDSKDLTGAVAAYRRAVELDPGYVDAYKNLGVALNVQGDVPGAVAAFKRVVELDPQSAAAHLLLGAGLQNNKDLPGAVAAYKKAIQLDPGLAVAHCNLGITLLAQRNLAGAVAALKKAVELNPRDVLALYSLGKALYGQKDLSGAIAAYKRAIAIAPGYAPAYVGLGVALRDNKDVTAAVAALKKAIELDPGQGVAHYFLGSALQLQRQYAEAERAYLRALKAAPAFLDAYNSLARLLATCPDDKVRDGKRAIKYASTACKRTGWREPRYLDTLAAACAEAGQFEDAIRYQKRALEDPTFKATFGPEAGQRLELFRQGKPFRGQ